MANIDLVPKPLFQEEITEVPDSTTVFKDDAFIEANSDKIETDCWLRIGRFYKGDATEPLLPEKLSIEQFEQGDHFECFMLSCLASLITHHASAIRSCFVTKRVRRDGRYTFQFYRGGSRIKVEIDDRIPLVDGDTFFMRSPTGNWWPILLEKAHAKFYGKYFNVEGCSLQEAYYDLTGCPVISIPMNLNLTKNVGYFISDPLFWIELGSRLSTVACSGLSQAADVITPIGLRDEQAYGLLEITTCGKETVTSLDEVFVHLYNPFMDDQYTGSLDMTSDDFLDIIGSYFHLPVTSRSFCMTASEVLKYFLSIQQCFISSIVFPPSGFRSEWGQFTAGGSPTVVTWRNNPLYVFQNDGSEPLQLAVAIVQKDQREFLDQLPDEVINYMQCGLIGVQSMSKKPFPTHFVCGNMHRTIHKGLFVNSREVCNLVTIPKHSLCYMVPTQIRAEEGDFLLMVWYLNREDAQFLDIFRYQPTIDIERPLVQTMRLGNQHKGRLDFFVDCPTEAHILAFQSSEGEVNLLSATSLGYIGLYLYNESNTRIAGTSAAMNYREICLSYFLPTPGRYALSITCPRAPAPIELTTTVLCSQQANLRITEAPEGATDFEDLDMDFLDQEIQHVNIEELCLDEDEEFQNMVRQLKEMNKDSKFTDEDKQRIQNEMRHYTEVMARHKIAEERDRWIIMPLGISKEVLYPILDADDKFTELEVERFILRKDPRNGLKIAHLEAQLNELVVIIAEQQQKGKMEQYTTDGKVCNIPLSELNTAENAELQLLLAKVNQLEKIHGADSDEVRAASDEVRKYLEKMVKELHDKERAFLAPEARGVPIVLLRLDEHPEFVVMEEKLRGERKAGKRDLKAIRELEDELREYVRVTTTDFIEEDLLSFLSSDVKGINNQILRMMDEPKFEDIALKRYRLLAEDSETNKPEIAELEDKMKALVKEMESEWIQTQRQSFLKRPKSCANLKELPLNTDQHYVELEKLRLELLSQPNPDMKRVQEIEDELNKLVEGMALKRLQSERNFLDSTAMNIPLELLNLDSDEKYMNLENRRAFLKSSGADKSKIQELEKAMKALIEEKAAAYIIQQRQNLLSDEMSNIPLDHLHDILSNDPAYKEAEKRYYADLEKNELELAKEALEDMKNRAEELAKEEAKKELEFLEGDMKNLNIRLLDLSDPKFKEYINERRELLREPEPDTERIDELEKKLHQYVTERVLDCLHKERETFIQPAKCLIPLSNIPMDEDKEFMRLEVERLNLKSEDSTFNARKIRDLTNQLEERKEMLAERALRDARSFLPQQIFAFKVNELGLDDNSEFLELEKALRDELKSENPDEARINEIKAQMKKLVENLAAERLWEERKKYLPIELDNIPLQSFDLENNPAFMKLEAERMDLIRKNGPQSSIHKMEDELNQCLYELLKQKNEVFYKEYNKAPELRGMKVEYLNTSEDETFQNLANQRNALIYAEEPNKEELDQLHAKIIQRVIELANTRRESIRDEFINGMGGIPLSALHLNENDEANRLEVELQRLKVSEKYLQGRSETTELYNEALKSYEKLLTKSQEALRENFRKRVLGETVQGVSRQELPLNKDNQYQRIEVECIRLEEAGTGEETNRIQELHSGVQKRAAELAHTILAEGKKDLNEEYYGVSIELLDVNTDPVFLELQNLLRQAKKNNDQAAIAKIQADMNQYLQDKALKMLQQERSFMPQVIEGRSLEELNVNDDAIFLNMEKQRREIYSSDPNSDELSVIEGLLIDRAVELANQLNVDDRSEYINQAPEGVPLSFLPLEKDKQFHSLEIERATLLQNRRDNAEMIKEKELAINDYLSNLARETLHKNQSFMPAVISGVKIEYLKLDKDENFRDLQIKHLILLSQDKKASKSEVSNIEKEMKDYALAAANDLKARERALFPETIFGISLEELSLDDNEKFIQLENDRRQLKIIDGRGDDDADVQSVTNAILAQLEVIAEKKFIEDCHDLKQVVCGVPMDEISFVRDETFQKYASDRRRLLKDSNRDLRAGDQLINQMNDYLEEIVLEERAKLVGNSTHGIPLQALGLDTNRSFLDVESQIRRAKESKDSPLEKASLEEMIHELEGIVQKKADSMLSNENFAIELNIHGVDLSELALESDPIYRDLSIQYIALKSSGKTPDVIKAQQVEEQMNNRVKELALELIQSDFNGLPSAIQGLPPGFISPHKNPAFFELVKQLRAAEQASPVDHEKIKAIRQQMEELLNKLVLDLRHQNRNFATCPLVGVALNELPLDSDETFTTLEAARLIQLESKNKKNATVIKDLERQLNEQIIQLGKNQIKEDMLGMPTKPLGVPIEFLSPYTDNQFSGLVQELRAIKSSDGEQQDHRRIEEIHKGMKNCLMALANSLLESKREAYLQCDMRGVRMQDIDFQIPQINSLEVRRLELIITDPEANRASIADLEQNLNEVVKHEIQKLLANEMNELHRNIMGVEVSCLHPLDDKEFCSMLMEWRDLRHETSGQAKQDAEKAKQRLNNRLEKMVKSALYDDEGFLNRTPGGIALNLLNIDDDSDFARLRAERAMLRSSQSSNDPSSEDVLLIEKKMNDYLENKARDLKDKAVDSLLLKSPELGNLDIPKDKGLMDREIDSLLKQRIELSADSQRNQQTISRVDTMIVRRMKEIMHESTDGFHYFLDRNPEGIPLNLLPLDTDPEYLALEAQLKQLRNGDPLRDRVKVKNTEEAMIARVKVLAEAQWREDLRTIPKNPRGIPLECLNLRENSAVQKSISQLRSERSNPSSSLKSVQKLEEGLNELVYQLADQLLNQNKVALKKEYHGVPFESLGAENDSEFQRLKVEHVIESSKHQPNAEVLYELEQAMDNRAMELAQEIIQTDLFNLPERPLGIHISLLQPHNDSVFQTLIKEHRQYRQNPMAHEEKIKILEEELSERVMKLAEERTYGDRDYLKSDSCGVSLEYLQLNKDKVFQDLETRRAECLLKGNSPSSLEVKNLESALNDRAKVLAEQLLAAEAQLYPDLHHHMESGDAELKKLVTALRTAKVQSFPDMRTIEEISIQITRRCDELQAFETKGKYYFLNDIAHGVPLKLLNYQNDLNFLRLEEQRHRLVQEGNWQQHDMVLAIEERMNDRIDEISRSYIRQEQTSLTAIAGSIPLQALHIEQDPMVQESIQILRQQSGWPDGAKIATPAGKEVIAKLKKHFASLLHNRLEEERQFLYRRFDSFPGISLTEINMDAYHELHSLEIKRLKLVDEEVDRDSPQFQTLENEIIREVQTILQSEIEEDFRSLPNEIQSIPTRLLAPHAEPKLSGDLKAIHKARQLGTSREKYDPSSVNSIEKFLTEKVTRMLENDRAYITPNINGLEVTDLPLSTDSTLSILEIQRLKLKLEDANGNAETISSLELRIGQRMQAIAQETIYDDLASIDDKQVEIPLTLLHLLEDPAILAILPELRHLKCSPVTNQSAIKDLNLRIRQRVDELTAMQFQTSRNCIISTAEGLPVSGLNLDADPQFKRLLTEYTIARLEADSSGNTTRLTELESQLNRRVQNLANAQIIEDLKGLEQNPCGIPVKILRPHTDSTFYNLCLQLREAKASGIAKESMISSLKDEMNRHLLKLAQQMIGSPEEFLHSEYEGIPLNQLSLEEDLLFKNMAVERASLRAKDSHRNAVAINDIERRMHAHAQLSAKEILKKDLQSFKRRYMGIDINVLKPHEYPPFSAHAAYLREAHYAGKSEYELESTHQEMEQILEHLAAECNGGRLYFIPKTINGMPLDELPLYSDPEFTRLDSEYTELLKRVPPESRSVIRALQEQMHKEAERIALETVNAEMKNLDPNPCGVPLSLLQLSQDSTFTSLQQQMRRLKRDPKMFKEYQAIQSKMNERARTLAKTKRQADRGYLPSTILSIPLTVLNVDGDSKFMEQELEHLILKASLSTEANKVALKELENRLCLRVEEIAKEQIGRDLAGFPTFVNGILIEALEPHKDTEFNAFVTELREFKLEPHKFQDKIQVLQEKMQKCLETLAEAAIMKTRDSYLPQTVLGISRDSLNINKSKKMTSLEIQLFMKEKENDSHEVEYLKQTLLELAQNLAREVMTEDLEMLKSEECLIPLFLIEPHNDPEFLALAEEHRQLKRDPKRHGSRIPSLIDRMQSRCKQLAKQLLVHYRNFLPEVIRGVPVSKLNLEETPEFMTLEIQRLMELKKKNVDQEFVEKQEEQMLLVLDNLASQYLQEYREFLDPFPYNIPLKEIALDADPAFLRLEADRLRLLNQGRTQADSSIQAIESDMQQRVHELALNIVKEDFSFISEAPYQIPFDIIQPHRDKEFSALAERIRHSLKDPHSNMNEIHHLKKEFSERAYVLALALLESDRGFLPEAADGISIEELPLLSDSTFHTLEVERLTYRVIDPKGRAPEIAALEKRLIERLHEMTQGFISQELLPLPQVKRGLYIELLEPFQDPTFAKLAFEVRQLRSEPDVNHTQISDLYYHMAERCDELALQCLENHRGFLDRQPDGIPLHLLPLSENEKFRELEVERCLLILRDPVKHSFMIRELETRMTEALFELIEELLSNDRDYLDSNPGGVPLEDIPFNTHTSFHEWEVERMRLKLTDAKRNANRIAELEEKLKGLTEQIGRGIMAQDLRQLESEPLGVAVELLNLHSNPGVLKIMRELRHLRDDPSSSVHQITETQGQLTRLVYELAQGFLNNERSFLDPNPGLIPLKYLPLTKDRTYHSFEMDLRDMRSSEYNMKKNKNAIEDLERRMNGRAVELALELRRQERSFLEAEILNIPQNELGLEEDEKFSHLEVERFIFKLENPMGASEEKAHLEQLLVEQAHELALSKKREERRFLDPTPLGIPLDLLGLDEDRIFHKMERQWRIFKKDELHNAEALQELEERMQDRAMELAEQMRRGQRSSYLEPTIKGIPFSELPLDEDPFFIKLETERAVLVATKDSRDEGAIRVLNGRLNERAHELATLMRREERSYLNPEPEGISLDELDLDEDPEFQRGEVYLRKLRQEPRRNEAFISDLKRKLNERVMVLVRNMIQLELSLLHPSYRGIPVEELDLQQDPEFRELSKRRRMAGRSRVTTIEMTSLIEDMNRRAQEVADNLICIERAFLDAHPEGIDLEDLKLDDDPVFLMMEAERRRRLRHEHTQRKNELVNREIEIRMNEHVHESARRMLEKLREFLPLEPEGIPLAELPLDGDAEFKDMELARYHLLKDPVRSRREGKLPDLEDRMIQRVRDLAIETLMKDRGFLNPTPEGVPLAELRVEHDNEFSTMAAERRRLKREVRRGGNADDVRQIEKQLDERCHELARQFLNQERSFLDEVVEGVPLEDLPLNQDARFRGLEQERLALKKDIRQANRVKEIEEELAERVEVLAQQMLLKERAFLDQEPLGIPISELRLNTDHVFNKFERQRRLALRNRKRNTTEILELEDQLQDRALELAREHIIKERTFLDPLPEGIPLEYLPLATDRVFRELEQQRREVRKKSGSKYSTELTEFQDKMNQRVYELARQTIEKGRAFLDSEPCGVPLSDLLLNADDKFRALEVELRQLRHTTKGSDQIRVLEDKLNNRAIELAMILLDEEREFLDPMPEGVSLRSLPLNKDALFRGMEQERRRLRRDSRRNYTEIREVETLMVQRVRDLARLVLAEDRAFLKPEPLGVPLNELPLNEDYTFHEMELERRMIRKDPRKQMRVRELEAQMNQRVLELAAVFIEDERRYLLPAAEGVPLSQLPLDSDIIFHSLEIKRRGLLRDPTGNMESIKEIEHRLFSRVSELATALRGYQDHEFFHKNHVVSDYWVRATELYPLSGKFIFPEYLSYADVASAPEDAGYLAPFLAAMAQHPVLLQRLCPQKEYSPTECIIFNFFDSESNPLKVVIDDHVPVTAQKVPLFTLSPEMQCWPLLVEKAYAKFVGGYNRLDLCTPHETLRDLTGRPVRHIPFDEKLAKAANIGDYNLPRFWRRIMSDLSHRDIITAMSSPDAPDGIHGQCNYALLGVYSLNESSSDPSSIIIKLHNTYRDAPYYMGPLHQNDPNWREDLMRICHFDPSRKDVLYLPLPTFLKNFMSLQHCIVNCGDRLTAQGEWDQRSAGGNPRFTSFRTNPIYLLENKASRPANVLVELRHAAPAYYDKEEVNHYHQTGLVLMESKNPLMIPTPLITVGSHKFLQKGMMLDAREVTTAVELPPNSTCYLIPYTLKRGSYGQFSISVYVGQSKVTLTPLLNAGLTTKPLVADLVLPPGGKECRRCEFVISEPCEVHILARQTKVTDPNSIKRGDAIAEDDVTLSIFNESDLRIASTGAATNAREHALVIRASVSGRYILRLACANASITGNCPVQVFIFTPKRVVVKLLNTGAQGGDSFCQLETNNNGCCYSNEDDGNQTDSRFPTLKSSSGPLLSALPSRGRIVSSSLSVSPGIGDRKGSLGNSLGPKRHLYSVDSVPLLPGNHESCNAMHYSEMGNNARFMQ